MLQRLRNLQESDKGFTLIELLVVVLIIAILAAIAIPIFLRQREKAYVADVQSTLRNAATAAESYSTTNNPAGSYTDFAASNDFTSVRRAGTQTLTAPTATATDYCIQVVETRLPADHEWRTGHFASGVGAPRPGACPV